MVRLGVVLLIVSVLFFNGVSGSKKQKLRRKEGDFIAKTYPDPFGIGKIDPEVMEYTSVSLIILPLVVFTIGIIVIPTTFVMIFLFVIPLIVPPEAEGRNLHEPPQFQTCLQQISCEVSNTRIGKQLGSWVLRKTGSSWVRKLETNDKVANSNAIEVNGENKKTCSDKFACHPVGLLRKALRFIFSNYELMGLMINLAL